VYQVIVYSFLLLACHHIKRLFRDNTLLIKSSA
jgi:hypothetical protein